MTSETLTVTDVLRMRPCGFDASDDGANYAGHVLPIWELRYPGDARVRECIATLHRWIDGDATDEELRAAAYAAAAYAAAERQWQLARTREVLAIPLEEAE